MGKRSNFERVERDYYPTPIEAVIPLIPHLHLTCFTGTPMRFAEPCAGDGRLCRHLESFGLKTYWASDIEPRGEVTIKADALTLTNPLNRSDYIITNPPWDRKILHSMIEHFRKQETTWLLFDADWMHTKQSATYMDYCEKIVSVGRIKWIEGSKSVGKDNCAWYKFVSHKTKTEFVGR